MFELTKKTWRITNIFSVRIREDNWYTCQAVDICFHDFCWIFFGSWKFVSQTYTFCRLCPFITFKGLKWLKCCDVWEGHEPRKTTRLFDPKSGKLSVISFIFKGLYSILEYIYIYILFILQKSGDHLRCFVFVKYESWEIFQKENIFRISWIRNNEPPIQSTTCLWPKNTVLEHSTTLPNHVEVHRFFNTRNTFLGGHFCLGPWFATTSSCHWCQFASTSTTGWWCLLLASTTTGSIGDAYHVLLATATTGIL